MCPPPPPPQQALLQVLLIIHWPQPETVASGLPPPSPQHYPQQAFLQVLFRPQPKTLLVPPTSPINLRHALFSGLVLIICWPQPETLEVSQPPSHTHQLQQAHTLLPILSVIRWPQLVIICKNVWSHTDIHDLVSYITFLTRLETQKTQAKPTCKQYFSTLDRFARACPWPLHEWPFLGEEEVVLGFVHKVPACFVALD